MTEATKTLGQDLKKQLEKVAKKPMKKKLRIHMRKQVMLQRIPKKRSGEPDIIKQ
ncbi:hypothetical protein EV146_102288 [Mesobacillus foraminis]|uniref:Uncharacterized protein n=1 Tax=Mesobacillus foraminis TaxID=279826 RepID=A0A4R2BJH9_9BACI|nr:hypothetical protein EV146_102288 [Mesobacillus foraminis]